MGEDQSTPLRPPTCGIPIELTGQYPCAVQLDDDGGHDGDCLTQPELDGTWPPPEAQPTTAREDPVIGLSTALFDLVERWTLLPPDARPRVTPPIATILDALQRQWLAQLEHAIATPDDEVPGG